MVVKAVVDRHFHLFGYIRQFEVNNVMRRVDVSDVNSNFKVFELTQLAIRLVSIYEAD